MPQSHENLASACRQCPCCDTPRAPSSCRFRSSQDLSLVDYSLLEFAHSDLAASALALAAHTHGAPHLAARLRELASGPLIAMPRLLALHHGAAAPVSEAVRDLICPLATKYAAPSWCCAARVAPLPALDPAWCL